MITPRLGRIFALLMVLAIAAGCRSRERHCAPPELSRTSGLVPVRPTGDEYNALDTTLIRSLGDRSQSAYDAPQNSKPQRVLALSGGGMYGAYPVGVLCGWTATGKRPTFDVVTGISTGALIGTYAFLGSEYDRQMAQMYTSITDRDIYRRRPVPAVLWSESAADSAPLKRLIDTQVDANVLRLVAAAHAAGRRFYVGTTNIDTRQLVIWDMGAIAASDRPDALELYRKILLASASPPGFLPPVEIPVIVNGRQFTELHVDGGATTGVFLRASMLRSDREALNAGHKPLAGSDAYVIVAGKLFSDPKCTDRRTVNIAENSLHALLYSQTRGELFRIYSLCMLAGMKFHLASIPEDFPVGTDAMSFDPAVMRRLYETGYAAATGGMAWRYTPPEAEPHEQTRPRSGNEFYAPGSSALPPQPR